MKNARLLLICLLVCSRLCWAADDGEEDGASTPIMVDAANGWRVEARGDGDTQLGYAVEHTADGGKHWRNVSPPALVRLNKSDELPNSDYAPPGLAVLDAARAWVAVGTHRDKKVLLASTDDGGKHWQQKGATVAAASAAIDFLDEAHGFLLAMGEPAASKMDIALYHTHDGGSSWQIVNIEMPRDSFYPTGLTFRTREQGWITATVHGEIAVPLFHSTDGGHVWTLQTLPYPRGAKDVHGNTYPPTFTGPDKQRGRLPVDLVYSDPASGDDTHRLIYETEDGGATWHLPASSAQPASRD